MQNAKFKLQNPKRCVFFEIFNFHFAIFNKFISPFQGAKFIVRVFLIRDSPLSVKEKLMLALGCALAYNKSSSVYDLAEEE